MSKFLAVAIGLWGLPAIADSAKTCPNLSGHYQLAGTWESSGVPHEAAPRVDQWAFAFVARAVTDPSQAVVVHDTAVGTVSVDIIGTGIDPRWKEASPSLPFTRTVKCSDGRWHLEHMSKGGGDNAPSTMKIRIALTLNSAGRLISEGSREVTAGYLVRNSTKTEWVASFARVAK